LVTVSVAVVLCVRLPLVPVMVSVKVPPHPETREANTLMHELAHLIIGHKPARLDITGDGLMILSSYDKQHEDEANWLAAALLLPREALLHARRQGMTDQQAAVTYGCSTVLFTMRIQTTGVDLQLRRSRKR
jgi:Zn-dependent peptidase ImmA (M78 family)